MSLCFTNEETKLLVTKALLFIIQWQSQTANFHQGWSNKVLLGSVTVPKLLSPGSSHKALHHIVHVSRLESYMRTHGSEKKCLLHSLTLNRVHWPHVLKNHHQSDMGLLLLKMLYTILWTNSPVIWQSCISSTKTHLTKNNWHLAIMSWVIQN